MPSETVDYRPQIESLKKSVPMWMVAQNYLKGMQRRGQEYDFLCPYHDDHSQSFQIYKASDGVWLGNCKACGVTKNVFQLLQDTQKMSFGEAFKTIQKMVSDPEWNQKRERVDAVFQSTLAASKEIASVPVENFESYVKAFAESDEAQTWLQARGIHRDTAELFSLGFVQKPHFQIVPTNHPWCERGWMLFPEIRDGRVVAAKYRSIVGKKGPNGESGFAQRKGMLRSPLYNQSAISPFEDLFIVEGELDCLTMAQGGFSSVSLPSAGYNPSADQRELLVTASARYLAGDTDDAGVACMSKLHKELGGENPKSKTYWLQWPKPYKDANQYFLEACDANIAKFKTEVLHLMQQARDRRLPGIHDLKTVARTANFKPTHDNPARLSFPWPRIDKWVDILPGEVMFAFATETKTGKSTWLMNVLMRNVTLGKKVINFSAELSPERYAQMVTAYITHRNRNTLTVADFQKAADILPENSFYIGYKPGAKFKDVIKLLEDAKSVYGGDIFVVDPLHFLIRGMENENAAFASAMKDLVDFAIKWNVIVIAIGQARKSIAGSKGKSAVGQDARFSAALSEDAATTWILHRNRIVRQSQEDEENNPVFEPITKVTLDYSRNSDPMSSKLIFDGSTASFSEYTGQQIQQEETNERSFNYGGTNGN